MANTMRGNFQGKIRTKNVSFRSEEDDADYDHHAPIRDHEAYHKKEREEWRSVQLLPDANMKISVSNDFRESRNFRGKDERFSTKSDNFRDDSNFNSNNNRSNNFPNRGYETRGRGGRGARGMYNRDSSGFHDQEYNNGHDNNQRNNRGRPLSGNYDTDGSRDNNRRSYRDRQFSGGFDQGYDHHQDHKFVPKNYNDRRAPGNYDREYDGNHEQSFGHRGYRGRGNSGSDWPRRSRAGRGRGRGRIGRSGEDGPEISTFSDGDKRSSQESGSKTNDWLEDECDESRGQASDHAQKTEAHDNSQSQDGLPAKNNGPGEWLEDEDPPSQDGLNKDSVDNELHKKEEDSEHQESVAARINDGEEVGESEKREHCEISESKKEEEGQTADTRKREVGEHDRVEVETGESKEEGEVNCPPTEEEEEEVVEQDCPSSELRDSKGSEDGYCTPSKEMEESESTEISEPRESGKEVQIGGPQGVEEKGEARGKVGESVEEQDHSLTETGEPKEEQTEEGASVVTSVSNGLPKDESEVAQSEEGLEKVSVLCKTGISGDLESEEQAVESPEKTG